ncbi:hypothetical protein CDAR_294311 [Caerostris darwini]|uniref:Uncharacterized protein n=1 Tax=Caerostris darwini TaxID=1538125 RepID=A0AAV4QZT9_9ARAC|nr:hypothetical protein CDAR_294311 [Caerostris darwini]
MVYDHSMINHPLFFKTFSFIPADRAPVRLCSEAFLAGALDRRNRGILVAAFPLHGPRHEASHAGDHMLPRQASRQQILMEELSNCFTYHTLEYTPL